MTRTPAAKGKVLVAKLRANPKVRDAEALAANLGRRKKLRSAGVSGKKAASLADKKGGMKEGGASSSKSSAADKGRKLAGKESGSGTAAQEAEIRRKYERDGEKFGWSKERTEGAIARETKALREKARERRDRDATATPAKKQADTNSITGGTDKQNKFATDVRNKTEKTLRDTFNGMMKDPRLPDGFKGYTFERWLKEQRGSDGRLEKMLKIKDPRFWIDVARGNEKSMAGIQNLLKDPRLKKYL